MRGLNIGKQLRNIKVLGSKVLHRESGLTTEKKKYFMKKVPEVTPNATRLALLSCREARQIDILEFHGKMKSEVFLDWMSSCDTLIGFSFQKEKGAVCSGKIKGRCLHIVDVTEGHIPTSRVRNFFLI